MQIIELVHSLMLYLSISRTPNYASDSKAESSGEEQSDGGDVSKEMLEDDEASDDELPKDPLEGNWDVEGRGGNKANASENLHMVAQQDDATRDLDPPVGDHRELEGSCEQTGPQLDGLGVEDIQLVDAQSGGTNIGGQKDDRSNSVGEGSDELAVVPATLTAVVVDRSMDVEEGGSASRSM